LRQDADESQAEPVTTPENSGFTHIIPRVPNPETEVTPKTLLVNYPRNYYLSTVVEEDEETRG